MSRPTDPFGERQEPKRICVIGAGANGLATLKVLAEAPQVQSGEWVLVAYEERENVGGIWYPSPPTGNPPVTPLYDSLTTNLPHLTMAFPSFAFPPETPLFPNAAAVQKYLEDYAAHFDLLRYVRFRTRVDMALWDADDKVWYVTLSTGETREYDFVVVSNGHYRKPRYPNAPGLKSWLNSGRAIHAAWYRNPCEYIKFKKVIVVGGALSALDICWDMGGVTPLPVLHSIPPTLYLTGFSFPPDTPNYRKVARIEEYRDDGAVVLADGTTESDVDLVILATGYEISFPFLPQMKQGVPPLPPPLPGQLYNSTYHVFPLAHHLFPLQGPFPPTSIAFPGLPYRVAPFPVFEDQARAIAPAVDVVARTQLIMQEEETDDPLLIAKAWFRFATLEPFEYRAKLHAFAGKPYSTPDWEVEFWEKKVLLRVEWKSIEESGQAEEWLRGVGANGPEDWIELCRKVIRQSEERNEEKTRFETLP
ncbi:hypothetical protein BC834DRAFT_925444 [Gloeopeniophorella convolvens]|nr:hypothetical protein BC834DRAFT_925444 [Gloeopeniophorella convolvens]